MLAIFVEQLIFSKFQPISLLLYITPKIARESRNKSSKFYIFIIKVLNKLERIEWCISTRFLVEVATLLLRFKQHFFVYLKLKKWSG